MKKKLFLLGVAIFLIANIHANAQEPSKDNNVLQDSLVRPDSLFLKDSLMCCDTIMCCDSVHREKIRFGIKIGGQVSRVDDIHDMTKQRIPEIGRASCRERV